MGIDGMTHEYGTVLILAALVLIVLTILVDVWITRLRSRHEALLRTPFPPRFLHVRGFGRSAPGEPAMRAADEAQRLEMARQKLESQLGQAVRTRAAKGPDLIKR